ncbi:hypothetical protein ACFO8O_11920 [Hephaestia sp. GCM10023244]|uniref:hypothetical protein n=1 Tax=unclassified Hephaestia TaxID=2631281 RepID=UPI00207709EB|nr:hypothetical protein [Hephaestia sp. MAHUQ-44]MCM8731665.1 hypothetical protein [Hephaestia sp. MAHUQ-44]
MTMKQLGRRASAFIFAVIVAGSCSAASARIADDQSARAPHICLPLAASIAMAGPQPIATPQPLLSAAPARLTTIRIDDERRSRDAFLTSCAAFLACAIVIGLQQRRKSPVKVVVS